MEGDREGWGSGWRSGANGQVRDPYIPGMMTGGGLLSCGFKLCFVHGTKLPRVGETSEGGGATQGWNIENLANHFREFGTYGVALGGATENSYREE